MGIMVYSLNYGNYCIFLINYGNYGIFLINYGNYGIFLIMGSAGFCPSTVAAVREEMLGLQIRTAQHGPGEGLGPDARCGEASNREFKIHMYIYIYIYNIDI